MSTETNQFTFANKDKANSLKQLDKTSITVNPQNINISKSINDLGLLTRNDVIDIFKINNSTLSRWQKNNTIPFIKIARRVYFKRSVIENLLNIKSN